MTQLYIFDICATRKFGCYGQYNQKLNEKNMGTIKNGFWKLSFILTPNEFRDFVKYCKELEIEFNDQRGEDIQEEYTKFYNSLISDKHPKKYLKQDSISYITINSFVCSLNVKDSIGFIISPANMVHWTHYREAVRIQGWAVQITLQKGVSVDKEDEKGKYFIYEDIQLHSPKSYPLYLQIISYIKNITKPLRFKIHNIDDVEEIKPPVRISEQVAIDLANSWIFKNYEFEMISYQKKINVKFS
ncbi:hypothetical protein DRF68_20085 [Candidatus Chryseobacterium massiliae]|uniref:Uncharacterized protein n=2 Tax=Chryseobacterium group TaxID=2782232 RepID=A0A3D9AGM5_9FLAO|nr:hypothetical protein DRF68_20085 [Candidatus Chryseobacterium massiliae]